jgi:replicative DNA helicase
LAIDERVPLFSYEAEMSTLGAMLLAERAAEEIVTILNEEDFYRPAHGLIFKAMKQLIHNHKPIDTVTLEDELKARGQLADSGGPNYILELANFTPSASNSNYYAQIVLDKATLRRLEQTGREIVGVVHDPDQGDVGEKVDKAEQLVFEVGRKQLGKYFTSVRSLAKEFFVDVDTIVESGQPMAGQKVDFADLDRLTSGFYPGDFVIIGARPAMGKTSLALDMALNVGKEIVNKEKRGSVAVFSLEMSSIQLVRRMASMISGVSMSVLKTGKITDDHYRRLADGCETLYELPIYIDDASDVTPLEMRGKCRRLKAEFGLTMVVVDYLQLMRGSRRTENRVQEISEIARACKSMAKELDCPVIALSQLNRSVESREDKRPQLSDIRESGSIEAEADLVMLLYREAYYKAKEEHRDIPWNPDEVEEAEVIVAKHRNGPTGIVKLGFQPAYARYKTLYRGGEAKDYE